MSRLFDVVKMKISLENGGAFVNLVEPSLKVCEIFDVIWKIPLVDKKKVISLHQAGFSRNSIANKLGVSRGMISRIIKSVDS